MSAASIVLSGIEPARTIIISVFFSWSSKIKKLPIDLSMFSKYKPETLYCNNEDNGNDVSFGSFT
jgi:hypothetical protein